MPAALIGIAHNEIKMTLLVFATREDAETFMRDDLKVTEVEVHTTRYNQPLTYMDQVTTFFGEPMEISEAFYRSTADAEDSENDRLGPWASMLLTESYSGDCGEISGFEIVDFDFGKPYVTTFDLD